MARIPEPEPASVHDLAAARRRLRGVAVSATGGQRAAVACANEECPNVIEGYPRDGRCERCYRWRKRHGGHDWPIGAKWWRLRRRLRPFVTVPVTCRNSPIT
jgi:hypothetical protein